MSFVFPSWETAFSPAFHESAKAMLEGALNKGNKPPVIQGHIEVVELSMGTQPPTLTLLEIGDLSLDRFRGILRLGYQGDAWLEVRCRVQANPLSHNPNLLPSSTLPLSTPLLASQPLLVPMTLRLSKLHLRAILILVVSASKGITLVFKNDPLQNVDVSSTFDSVEVIRGYLQQEIEGQLREMFREDLPGIIHRLSQRWFTGTGMGGKVEMPYRESISAEVGSAAGTPGRSENVDDVDPIGEIIEKPLFPPHVPSAPATATTPKRRTSQQTLGASSGHAQRARRSSGVSESPSSYTVFPDIEDYDPTYGLRPEGLPTHSGYEAFGRLWEKAREGGGRGLGSLMSLDRVGEEDRGDVSDADWDEDEGESLNMVEMETSLRRLGSGPRRPDLSRVDSARSTGRKMGEEDAVEWETFPAVGGGVITRPRVYHSQSRIRAPSEAGGAMPSPSATATGGSVTARASSVGGASSTVGSLRAHSFAPLATPGYPSARAGPSSLRRMVTSRSDVFSPTLRSDIHGLVSLPPSASYQSFQALPGTRQSSTFGRPMSSGAPRTTGQSSSRTSNPPRRGSNSTSTAARTTGGSSFETQTHTGPTRSTTLSTLASSQLPSSRSISINSQSPQTPTSPQSAAARARPRAGSLISTSPSSFPQRFIGPGGITLPLNNSVSQLATLSHSAHTLSPYARAHEHIAVRSFPYLGKSSSGRGGSGASASAATAAAASDGAVKARRKRIYRMITGVGAGRGPKTDVEAPLSPSLDRDGFAAPREKGREMSLMSPGLGNGGDDVPRQWRPASLTGVASQIMARPAYRRAPDTRTSYGFPAVERGLQ